MRIRWIADSRVMGNRQVGPGVEFDTDEREALDLIERGMAVAAPLTMVDTEAVGGPIRTTEPASDDEGEDD